MNTQILYTFNIKSSKSYSTRWWVKCTAVKSYHTKLPSTSQYCWCTKANIRLPPLLKRPTIRTSLELGRFDSVAGCFYSLLSHALLHCYRLCVSSILYRKNSFQARQYMCRYDFYRFSSAKSTVLVDRTRP